MKQEAVIAALTTASGIDADEIAAVAAELEQYGVANWTAHACAGLCMRLLRPGVSIEKFAEDSAVAPLDGINVQTIGNSQKLQGQMAADSPYAAWLAGWPTLIEVLGGHVSALAAGWESSTAYPRLLAVTHYQSQRGNYWELACSFSAHAFHEAALCWFIFGDATPWAANAVGFSQTLDGSVFTALAEQLRAEAQPGWPDMLSILTAKDHHENYSADDVAKSVTIH